MSSITAQKSIQATSPGCLQSIVEFQNEGVISLTKTCPYVRHLKVKQDGEADGLISKILKTAALVLLAIPLCMWNFAASLISNVVTFCAKSTSEVEARNQADQVDKKTRALAAEQLSGAKIGNLTSSTPNQQLDRSNSSNLSNGPVSESALNADNEEHADSLHSDSGKSIIAPAPTNSSSAVVSEVFAKNTDSSSAVPANQLAETLVNSQGAPSLGKATPSASSVTTIETLKR